VPFSLPRHRKPNVPGARKDYLGVTEKSKGFSDRMNRIKSDFKFETDKLEPKGISRKAAKGAKEIFKFWFFKTRVICFSLRA
jgi:hypothetical protein